MTIHQCQPSKTSCGPTVIAMIVGVPVSTILAMLPSVRKPARRHQRYKDRTNVGELIRLLRFFGWTLGRRTRGSMPDRRAILRVHRAHSKNWHWMLWDNGRILDPAGPTLPVYMDSKYVSWYPIEEA